MLELSYFMKLIDIDIPFMIDDILKFTILFNKHYTT